MGCFLARQEGGKGVLRRTSTSVCGKAHDRRSWARRLFRERPMAHRIADLRWTALAVVLTLFFSHAVLATAAPHRARRVLVLYSERKGNPIVDAIDRGFQSTLRARTA